MTVTSQPTYHEERFAKVTDVVEAAPESVSTDHPNLLRALLLKLTQLLSIFAAPLDYFETWSLFDQRHIRYMTLDQTLSATRTCW
jgi:hypothetical protein